MNQSEIDPDKSGQSAIPIDWMKAGIHLSEVTRKCVDGGSRGVQYYGKEVRPLKELLEAGERSILLFEKIMKLQFER